MARSRMFFYEVELGLKKELDDDSFCDTPNRAYIYVKAERFPSFEEIEFYCGNVMKESGYDAICSITRVTSNHLEGAIPIIVKNGVCPEKTVYDYANGYATVFSKETVAKINDKTKGSGRYAVRWNVIKRDGNLTPVHLNLTKNELKTVRKAIIEQGNILV